MLLTLACFATGTASTHAEPAASDWKAKEAAQESSPLTPEEERATFVLPEGYVAELVTAEPMVQEPVLAVWDGNGAMYVAEMRSKGRHREIPQNLREPHHALVRRRTQSASWQGDSVRA